MGLKARRRGRDLMILSAVVLLNLRASVSADDSFVFPDSFERTKLEARARWNEDWDYDRKELPAAPSQQNDYEDYENGWIWPEDSMESIVPASTPVPNMKRANVEEVQVNFALDLLREINAHEPAKSAIVSPFSIAVLLSMMISGAEGKTADELTREMGGEPADGIHGYFGKTLTRLNAIARKYSLKIANKIYLAEGHRIGRHFAEIARDNYDAAVKKVNFRSGRASSKINNDVVTETNGKIQEIISEDDIDEKTSLILLNAIYFNAKWENQFNENDTVRATFSRSNTDAVQASFMRPPDGLGNYKYFANSLLKCVMLPFEDDDIRAYFILPKRRFGLNEVLEKFTAKQFREIVDGLKEEEVELKIPKFNITSDLNAKELLKKKFPTALTGYARFDGISERITVDQFKQKATIQVNEKGAEAAAATAIGFSFRSLSLPVLFTADEPFLLLLADKHQTIYFEAIVRL